MSTSQRKTEARRRRFWTTAKVTVASLAAAAALTGGLAGQMASGNDPAISGSSKSAVSKTHKPASPAPLVTRAS